MKIITKIAAIVVLAALAASTFGCGSSSTDTESSQLDFEPQNIEVNDSGYAITDEGKLSYAFVAVNPNDGYIAENTIFTVEAYDSNGSMIAGGGDTISALYPGVETAGAGEVELFSRDSDNPKVARLSVTAMMDSCTWTPTSISNSDLDDSIEIVKPRMSNANGGGIEVTASVRLAEGDGMKLDLSQPIELRAVALLFDDAGLAVYGTSPEVFTLSEDERSFNFRTVIENAPEFSECNLYVAPTN